MMPKREWPVRFICSHDGCNESVTYRYDTRRDLMESFELKWYSGGRWKCQRHSDLDRVLSSTNRETRFEIESKQESHGRYFGHSGQLSGPGFLAIANDFPPGTKLIVTARIEFPPAPERPLIGCAASRDGECRHSQCPQLRDNEPNNSGRHCPLDKGLDDD